MSMSSVFGAPDPSVSLNSFNLSSTSVIVFGAAKWMRLARMRTRVLDGMIDQIEIYDSALTQGEVAGRYDAFAGPTVNPVPKPSSAALLVVGVLAACAVPAARSRQRSARRQAGPGYVGA